MGWVVTINGIETLAGEIADSLEGLVQKKSTVRVHVADIASREYDVIFGCDIMESKSVPKIEVKQVGK